MTRLQLNAIGTVHNSADEPVDENWGSIRSTIEIDASLAGALDGLDGFSHAIIVTYLHQTPETKGTRRRPRGRADMPEVGLFAQRARHRPNPIAITAVEIVRVGPTTLIVQGLDAIDGTPVLDIKPYYPIYDRRDATTPAWVDELMKGYFTP